MGLTYERIKPSDLRLNDEVEPEGDSEPVDGFTLRKILKAGKRLFYYWLKVDESEVFVQMVYRASPRARTMTALAWDHYRFRGGKPELVPDRKVGW